MKEIVLDRSVSEWVAEFPVISDIMQKNEVVWLNDQLLPFESAIVKSELQASDIKDASERLDRFASYFKKVFPVY